MITALARMPYILWPSGVCTTRTVSPACSTLTTVDRNRRRSGCPGRSRAARLMRPVRMSSKRSAPAMASGISRLRKWRTKPELPPGNDTRRRSGGGGGEEQVGVAGRLGAQAQLVGEEVLVRHRVEGADGLIV